MLDGGPWPLSGRENWEVEPPAKTCNCKLQPVRESYTATWRIQTSNWVDLPRTIPFFLPNYLGPCFDFDVFGWW